MWETLGGAAILLILTLYALYDKQKSRYIGLQAAFREALRKARADRNNMVRIPAERIAAIFELDDERTIVDPPKAGKLVRHPATQPPGRGKG